VAYRAHGPPLAEEEPGVSMRPRRAWPRGLPLQCVRVRLHLGSGHEGARKRAGPARSGYQTRSAEHKCSNGCDEAGAEPHNILCVVGEMVAWQCAPKE
jgi:hypothetical protein